MAKESSSPITLTHNLKTQSFKWLWMKYVNGVNTEKHCTNCLRGKYSKVLSGHNEQLNQTGTLVLDEQARDSYSSIYICGVIKKGYPRSNYTHNLHTAIAPREGHQDHFVFEEW